VTLGLIVLVGFLFTAALKAAPSDYDDNGDGYIQQDEVIAAINDYLFDGSPTRTEVIQLIEHYLFDIPVEPPPPGQLTMISSGRFHACGLEPDGSAVCWGGDGFGQASPPAGERFVSISSGLEHTCALRTDGRAVCWGSDRYGRSSPPAGERFVSISSGGWHTCGLRSDGRAVCWGGEQRIRDVPQAEIAAIGGGWWHSCALRPDGSPVCWGSNQNGELLSPDGERFMAISGGRFHTCALRTDGSVVCWGGGHDGQRSPPRGERFTAISSGEKHTCGLRSDGRVVCWGDNSYWQTTPGPDERFVAVSAGGQHTCALRPDGEVVCWGRVLIPPSVPASPGPRPTPEPVLIPTPQPSQPSAPQGRCADYDSGIDWLESAYGSYSICYTERYAGDVAFAKRWIDHAQNLMSVKYGADLQDAGVHLNVMLLPEPDENADTGTTRFQCCYSGFARIPYLTPSHPDWSAHSRWGVLRLPPDDFHAKNLVHEFTHAGQYVLGVFRRPVPTWVYEGLAEYEGMFHATEHNRTVGFDSLIRYARESIPDQVFLAGPFGGDRFSLTTSDVYFGGNVIMTYLADRFGEDMHSRLVRHTYASFDEALWAEFEAAGTTTPQVFADLQAWLAEHPAP